MLRKLPNVSKLKTLIQGRQYQENKNTGYRLEKIFTNPISNQKPRIYKTLLNSKLKTRQHNFKNGPNTDHTKCW